MTDHSADRNGAAEFSFKVISPGLSSDSESGVILLVL